MRKVHASTGCDACSVCARRNHKPRDEKSLRQLKWLSPWIGQSRLESATVTESFWKQREWNAVNPSSQQPKFWSGHGVRGNERSTLTAISQSCQWQTDDYRRKWSQSLLEQNMAYRKLHIGQLAYASFLIKIQSPLDRRLLQGTKKQESKFFLKMRSQARTFCFLAEASF